MQRKSVNRLGGHLATITSAEEEKFVELLNDEGRLLWFGLYKNGDNGWGWVTKEPLEYTHWANGEPNDYATREFQFENAGVLHPEWFDYHENNFNEIYGYLCEWDEVIVDVDSVVEEGTIIEPESLGVLNDHTYHIVTGKYTWSEAKEMCEALGGHLATIVSPDEQRFLDRLNKSNKNYWFGLYKGKNGNDEWGWVTEEALSITCWAQGEPNNYFTREYQFENAGVFGDGWNDCHEKNISDISGFICEWDYVLDYNDSLKEKEKQLIETNKVKTYKKHKYLIVEEKCTWTEAKEKCEAMGGHLATITSAAEQQFIEQLLPGRVELWIGMHRDNNDAFYWVTGEEIDYNNWRQGEPNNYGAGENSVAMCPEWNDYDENNTGNISGFVCEWDEYTGKQETLTEELESNAETITSEEKASEEVTNDENESVLYSQSCQFFNLTWGRHMKQ